MIPSDLYFKLILSSSKPHSNRVLETNLISKVDPPHLLETETFVSVAKQTVKPSYLLLLVRIMLFCGGRSDFRYER